MCSGRSGVVLVSSKKSGHVHVTVKSVLQNTEQIAWLFNTCRYLNLDLMGVQDYFCIHKAFVI